MANPQQDIDAWKNANWKEFQKNVFRLQKRLFKAHREGNRRKVSQLQRLILRSHSARMLAVRQVTQLNKGKRTAGIDGQANLSPKERLKLANKLRSIMAWEHKPLRREKIPKKDGTTRNLGIPTIADRAAQSLVKTAIEPAHEAEFAKAKSPSFGFRPGHCQHDAMDALFKKLCGTRSAKSQARTKYILEVDIQKCFDEIDHQYLESQLICNRKIKSLIQRMLKAGVKGEFPLSEKGTPQGGTISPLLANIALHGLEDGLNVVRYADDFVCVCRSQQEANKALESIKLRLLSRGLKIKEAKTQIIPITKGFNFLGWNFKWWKDDKFRITPAKENITAFVPKIKQIRRKSSHLSHEDLLKKINPLIRGWLNYHKYCGNRSKSDERTMRTLWINITRYLKRKHHKKFTWKRFAQQWQPWFAQKMVTTGNVPTARWIKVQMGRSIFDGDLAYWSKRTSKSFDTRLAQQIRKQNHQCGQCGLVFTPGENIELHHIDGNHQNWKAKNLVALHKACHQHQEIHSVARKVRTRAGAV